MASLTAVPTAGCLSHPAVLLQRNTLVNRAPLQTRGSRCVARAAADAVEEETPLANSKIRVKLTAYRTDLLTEAVDMIRTSMTACGARMKGPVPLPTKRRIYTLLRSPHVNKDSREQFERRTHFRLIDLRDLTPDGVTQLMALALPAGVQIRVSVTSW